MQPVAVQATDAPVLPVDKEYVAHKIASTGTVKEGGLSPPSSCEGGATAPLAPPYSYALGRRRTRWVFVYSKHWEVGVEPDYACCRIDLCFSVVEHSCTELSRWIVGSQRDMGGVGHIYFLAS